MQHAKVIAAKYELGPPEQLPYFMVALKSEGYWTLVLGKWRKRLRKPQSEETKKKISNSMKGKRNRCSSNSSQNTESGN